jgi:hypothetical protein
MEKLRCVFVREPNDGEPWAYCGQLREGRAVIEKELACFVNASVEELLRGRSVEPVTIEFKVEDMPQEEIDSLPEL